MGPFLIRTALTGFALWVVTLVVPGIFFVGGDNTLQKIGIILVVAVIFGLVNAFIKPIVQILAIPLYILTLGLIHIVINAFMLWITSWITRHVTHWGLDIDHFWWTAIWGAIVLSIVGWALGLLTSTIQTTTVPRGVRDPVHPSAPPGNGASTRERVAGFEPALTALQAGAYPLGHTRAEDDCAIRQWARTVFGSP